MKFARPGSKPRQSSLVGRRKGCEPRSRKPVMAEPHSLLTDIYVRLLAAFGPQAWWPAETPFEVMVGAILTQNTAWRNVEQAIENLKARECLDPRRLLSLAEAELGSLIRPSGYYNLKARRLRAYLEFFVARYGGSVARMSSRRAPELRQELLAVWGVGPETADCILLYALGAPTFVVDAYTRRVFSRVGLVDESIGYDELQSLFLDTLPENIQMYKEYHALIVVLGKDICKPKPRCDRCPIRPVCGFGDGVRGED